MMSDIICYITVNSDETVSLKFGKQNGELSMMEVVNINRFVKAVESDVWLLRSIIATRPDMFQWRYFDA